jgi:hypothetical protein
MFNFMRFKCDIDVSFKMLIVDDDILLLDCKAYSSGDFCDGIT